LAAVKCEEPINFGRRITHGACIQAPETVAAHQTATADFRFSFINVIENVAAFFKLRPILIS